jgi:hypothetical protein
MFSKAGWAIGPKLRLAAAVRADDDRGVVRGFAQPKHTRSEDRGADEGGLVASGNALIGRLLRGCLDRNISIQLETRARARQDGCRRGPAEQAAATSAGARRCRARVGRLRWNAALRDQFLPGPISHSCSPPYNEGDGLLMAQEAGAGLGNMTEAWLYPGAMVPGEEHEGQPVSRWVVSGERCRTRSW